MTTSAQWYQKCNDEFVEKYSEVMSVCMVHKMGFIYVIMNTVEYWTVIKSFSAVLLLSIAVIHSEKSWAI